MEQTVVSPPRVVRIIEPTISVRESVKTHYRVLRVAAYCRANSIVCSSLFEIIGAPQKKWNRPAAEPIPL